ncbi:hypothetical protein C4N9_00675 [Pararhodobacter marinus]|uniref:Short-chain dehydrogenase n=1 Tax=Pararhodobacter marinus TaxID=2184063 RepID=A0A2U2CIF8_9RHOB|nr:hypothetical protein [Pararhodobacter marinus]PWE31564.1 hypothetical protein C4N9_00675 [Pararhodobacter marinus]
MTAHPPLLRDKRIAVMGSGSGLGLAVARAAEAAGAEVLGIDREARFDHLAELYRLDPGDPASVDALAQALPDDLDGLALFPALPDGPPARQLAHGLAAPKRLAALLAPRLAPGAGIVVRGATADANRTGALAAIRAGASLAPGDCDAFAERWSLNAEPTRTPRLIGWAMTAWAQSRAVAWPGLRVNAVIPAAPDGRLPLALAADLGLDAGDGASIAARAAIFLLSDLAQGLTGASLAADGGLSAQTQTRLEGL